MFKKMITGIFACMLSVVCTASVPNTYIAFISGFGNPNDIAITPNGNYAYVADSGSNSVLVIDTNPLSPTFNQLVPAPDLIGAFSFPDSIAITPDGKFAYVVSFSDNSVYVIDTSSNMIVPAPGLQGTFTGTPESIAIAPNGLYAYVTNVSNALSVIDLTTNTIFTTVNGLFNAPGDIAITPNGNYAYVTNKLDGSVTVIDTNPSSPTFNQQVSAPGLGPGLVNSFPLGIAITTNGLFAYVTDLLSVNVTFLNLTTNTVSAAPNLATAFRRPIDVVTTSDGNYAYVANFNGASGSISNVSVIDTNPSSPTYNSTLSTPGLVMPTFPHPVHFVALAATPNAQFVYVLDESNNIAAVIFTGIITLQPPLNFKACRQRNAFLLQTDLINHLTWSPPNGTAPVSYRIYRGANLQNFVAVVPATRPLEYDDHNRSPFVQDTYYIVSVDSSGNMSSPVSTTPTAACS